MHDIGGWIADLGRRGVPDMGTWLGDLRPSDWSAVDVTVRHEWTGSPIGASDARRTPDEAAALSLLSMQPDGRTREQILNRMAELGDPRCLPAVALRLNDWVPQVRAAAERAFERLSTPDAAPELLRAWPILASLGTGRRNDAAAQKSLARASLVAPAVRPTLRSTALTPTAEGLAALEILVELGEPDRTLVLEEILQSGDLPYRRSAAAALRRVEEASDRRRLALLAARDRAVTVRSRAWSILGEDLTPLDARLLEDGLHDPSSVVRWTAQAIARRQGVDPGNVYAASWRARSAKGRTLVGLLRGTRDLGLRRHAADVAALARDAAPRTRALALAVWADLDPDGAMPALIDAVQGASGTVARAAARILVKKRIDVTLDQVLAWLRAPATRGTAVTLAVRLPKWDELLALLLAVDQDDEGIARRAAGDLRRRWLPRANRSAMWPDRATLRRLESAARAAQRRPWEWPRDEVASWLLSAGRMIR